MKRPQSLRLLFYFYVLSLMIMLGLYYGGLLYQLKQQTQRTSLLSFQQLALKLHDDTNALHLETSTQIVSDIQHLIKQNIHQDINYQYLLITPSGQTLFNTYQQVDHSVEPRFILPKMDNPKSPSFYQCDFDGLYGWINLNNGYQVYINLQHSPLIIPWHSMLLWLPLPLVAVLILIAGLFLRRRRHNWEQAISHLGRISRSDTQKYYPLSFSKKNSGQEFQRLAYAIDRLHYQLTNKRSQNRELNQQLQYLAYDAPVALMRLDAEGRIVYLNRFCQHLLHSSLKIDDKPKFSDLFFAEDEDSQHILDTLNQQHLTRHLLLQQHDYQHYYQCYIQPWLDHQGQSEEFTVVIVDVHTLVNQLHTSSTQLKKQHIRLADYDRLWSLLGHELRTPLSGIIGMLDLIDKQYLSSDTQEILTTLTQTSQSMLALLNDILDMAKADAGKLTLNPESTDILALCKQVCELMVGNARRQGIELLYYFDPQCPRYLHTDPTRLRQILLNLLSNAIKFTHSGYVALIIEPVEYNHIQHLHDALPRISEGATHKPLPQHASETWLRFAVVDTGIGIDSHEQAKLFNYFHQANDSISRQFGGTGLGLAISNNFSKMLGGFINLTSNPATGSDFSVYLPKQRASYQPVYAYNVDLSAICLLVFTSQTISQQHLSALFNHLQLAAVIMQGVSKKHIEHANRQLRCFSHLMPILLVDYELYDTDDCTLLQQLNCHEYAAKILLSMMPERGILSHIMDGYDGFLNKPLDVSHLISELMRLTTANPNASNDQCSNDQHASLQQRFSQFVDSLEHQPAAQSDTTPLALTHQASAVDSKQAANSSGADTATADTDPADGIQPITTTEVINNSSLILVAEDNPVNQKVACKILEKMGYTYVVAGNGQEALEILAQQRDQIKLILMDCRMPIMDGLTASRQIRDNQDSIPIIALTANDTDEDRMACFDAGMDDFIAKPLKKPILAKILQSYLPH